MTTDQLQLERKSGGAMNAELATVAIVVPVRNEGAFIARTLDQLLDQELDGIRAEIIVVDGQSTDRTTAIVEAYAERYPAVRLLHNPQRLSSAARNLAIRNSTSEYLVIVDGHCEIPSKRYLRNLVDAFQESGADCLGRPQPLDTTNASSLQKAIALARSSRLGHHPESFIYSDQPQFVPAKSVAVAYRREVFDKIGLFDESFDAHEDGEFNYRCDKAGLKCYFDPQLAVKYVPRSSFVGLFRQMVRYGRGRVKFSRKHPGTWGLGALIPALFVLYVLGGGLLAIALPGYRIAYCAGLAIYSVAIAAFSIQTAHRERNALYLAYVPLVLIVVHLGAGAGILFELFNFNRHRTG